MLCCLQTKMVSFLPFKFICIFSWHIFPARISSTKLNRSNKVQYPRLLSDLREIALCLSLLSIMLAFDLLYVSFMRLRKFYSFDSMAKATNFHNRIGLRYPCLCILQPASGGPPSHSVVLLLFYGPHFFCFDIEEGNAKGSVQ